MNLQDALQAAGEGKKVKLPEWSGYWFIPSGSAREDGDLRVMIAVFTKDGDVLDTPWFDKYKDRTDFEVTEGKLGFGFALAALESGKKVCRSGWNGKGMWLQLQMPDENSKMGHPYPYMKGVDGKLFPWNPNCLDMMAKDWEVAKES